MKLSVDGQEYALDLTTITNREAIAIQKHTGLTFPEMLQGLGRVDAYAMTAIVWLAYTRAGNKIEFDNVDFDLTSIDVELDELEKKAGSAKPKDRKPKQKSSKS